MKYEYKVVIVKFSLGELNKAFDDGWEVFMVTAQSVTGQFIESGNIFYTLRREKQ